MPLTRRQVFRRRRILVASGALFALGTGFYLPIALLAPLPEVSAQELVYEAPVPAVPTIDFPTYGASGIGALGYDGVLASSGVSTPLPLASISKIITALVVLERKPLALTESGPTITFTVADEQFYDEQLANDGTVEVATAGQQLSVRNVLDVMLMESANNYAQTLAVWAFGSEDAYIAAAQDFLARHALRETSIADPTGINPANTSTVTDLIELAKLALAHPVIAQIVGSQSLTIPGIGEVENRNGLLGVDGVNGIKTGTLEEAGSCLLFSASHQVGEETITLVGVVLGGPDHDTINRAIRLLLAQATAGFVQTEIVASGEAFASYSTVWGDEATAVASESASLVVWSALPVSVDVETTIVHLAQVGDRVGTLVFTVGERVISVPLELDRTLADPGAWWRLTNPQKLF